MTDIVNISSNPQNIARPSASIGIHSVFILIFILLMFVADGLNSVLLNSQYDYYRISIFIRIFVQAYFILLLLHNHHRGRLILLFFVLSFVFLLGTLAGFNSLYTWSDYHLSESFVQFDKMFFFFIVWETLRHYFPKAEERNKLFNLFEFIILTQSIIIIIGFVFDIKLFAAYVRAGSGAISRFGYQGLIPAQNEVSAFFILAFFYFLIKVSYRRQGFVGLILTTVAGVLTGTKVTLILPIILAFYVLGWLVKYTRTSRKYLPLAIIVLILGLTVFISRGYLLSRLQPTINYFSYSFDHDNRSLISIIVSGRDIKVQNFISMYLSKFNLFNYLFGGQDLARYSTEMDIIDVFARLGLIGGLIFYFYYVRLLLIPYRTIDLNRILFIFIWLGVSILSGHIIFSAINATYLAILLVAFTTFEGEKIYKRRQATVQDQSNAKLAIA